MRRILYVSALMLMVAACAARHAPRVSCSGHLEDINPPRSADSSPHDPAAQTEARDP
ncbi:MAG: hypothetical protein WDO68_01800 [Gammaproteobacteria bacterium]